jgi:hypothetical protein
MDQFKALTRVPDGVIMIPTSRRREVGAMDGDVPGGTQPRLRAVFVVCCLFWERSAFPTLGEEPPP